VSICIRIYSARIAPCSTTWREAIYNGAVVVHHGRRWTESFAPDAFIATEQPVPIVLSHDEGRPVGRVTVRIAHRGWHIADFQLDHSLLRSAIALDLLRVGAPVSIGFHPLAHDELLAEDNIKWHTLCRLDEISILTPNETPAFKGAQITSILEPRPTARQASREKAPDSEDGVVTYGGPTLYRYFKTPITIR
jgi:Caudovirus prohead serine protease